VIIFRCNSANSRFIICVCFLMSILQIQVAAAGDKPRLKNVRWFKTDDGYRVTAILQNGFNKDIEERINAGIPTSFHYILSFKRMRWYWDNRILQQKETVHTVTYDTLLKKYTIVKQRLNESESFSTVTTDDSIEMRRLMTRFEGHLYFQNRSLKPNRRHYISIRATLQTERLPPPWDTILFFISNDFDTNTSRQFLPVKE
jgi:Domain of unknown function (DUF4390)